MSLGQTQRILRGFRCFSYKHGCISKGPLEGSTNTDLRKKSPRVSTSLPTNFHAFSISFQGGRLPKHGKQLIFTLDPNKFAEKKQQRLHLGDVQSFGPFVSLLNRPSPVVVPRIQYDMSKLRGKPGRPIFPTGTKAFMYYSVSPGKPRIAGEIRLRVTSSDDPASFESGSDLLRTNGRPWSRPLYVLSKYSPPLYEKLREDGFVPDDLDRVLSTFPTLIPKYGRSHFFYTLNDNFIIDFSSYRILFFVITEQGVGNLPFNRTIYDGRNNAVSFTGTHKSPSPDTPILIILMNL